MVILQGTGVSPGIVFGKLCFCGRNLPPPDLCHIEDCELEKVRLQDSLQKAKAQLEELAAQTEHKLGQANSQIFFIHKMMLEDLAFQQAVYTHIENEHICAEAAVDKATQDFATLFSEIQDDYLKARLSDIYDVSNRVIDLLQGNDGNNFETCNTNILAGDDFSPSQTAQLDRRRVSALAMREGFAGSHAAIFARSMGIAAVIGLKDTLHKDYAGLDCILDGSSGEIIIEPSEELRQTFLQKKLAQDMHFAELSFFYGKTTLTKSGRSVPICANIGSASELPTALAHDAEGIGLFRSEFLYLGRNDLPKEDEQYQAYRDVLQKMNGRPVTIRTLDIGADKQLPALQQPKEENPALGLRALRLCLQNTPLFKTQLRALYRASAHGNLSLMFPMLTTLQELKLVKTLLQEIQDELQQENLPFDKNLSIGLMIETPAAAIISDLLAKEVDFFSIGSNDLTQYTLAVDRQTPAFEFLHSPPQESVVRLMKLVCQNAHKAGIPVRLCGELAGDLSLTPLLLELGLDGFSVAPSVILPLRQRISELDA